MRELLVKHRTLIPFYILLVSVLIWSSFFFKGSFLELWISADQKGYNLYQDKAYEEAADSFESQSFKGASYFKAGNFKKAKAIYITGTSKEARYNLGNTQMMLGKYDKAIEAYSIALKIDSSFTMARDNLALAKARKRMREVENDGEQGVGELGADKIKYDNKGNKGVDATQEGSKETTQQTNANWLDRIETSPKSFLKNKFSYQYQMKDVKNVK